MDAREKASLQSQLRGEGRTPEDTEDMFWLRENDDAQSKTALGNALAGQYRFREAAEAYREALAISEADPMTWLRLGGAELTLFHYKEALSAFRSFLGCGGSEKAVAYHMGFWYYQKRDYRTGARWFSGCLPCGDELKIAVIYWHTLCCLRGGIPPVLLEQYTPGMDVGHHTAYRTAVEVMRGLLDADEARRQLETVESDLDFNIVLYGILRYLDASGHREYAGADLSAILSRDRAWPNLSYLAAWNDAQNNGGNL